MKENERKILIIGGNGFIGKNLAKRLVKRSDLDIHSFDLTIPEEKTEGVHYIEGDFFDNYVLEETIEDMDLVIHSLSTVNPGNSNKKYMEGYSRDFLQTVNLCGMLIKQKINRCV